MMPAAILSLLIKTEGAAVATAELNAVDRAGARAAAGGLAKTEAAAVKSDSSLRKAAKGAAAFGAALGAFKGIEKSVSTTEDLAHTTIGLQRNFGLATKAASEWAAVAESRNIATKQLSMSFKTLSKQVQGAESGSKTAVAEFKALGISQQELAAHGNDLNWVLTHVSDGLAQLPAGTQRAALAGTLFGRTWQSLSPLLRNGSAAMNEQLGLADKYGATLGGNGVKSVEKMIQAQRESNLAFLGLQVTIGTTVIPVLTQLIAKVAEVVNWFRQHAAEAKALGTVVIGVTAVLLTYKAAVFATSVATKAMAIATNLATAAQWALNAAALANPYVAVAAAVLALNAAVVVLYLKVKAFHNFVNKYWPLLFGVLVSPFAGAVIMISKHAGEIKNAVVGAFHAIIGAVKGLAGSFVGLGGWAIARMVDGIHAAAGKLLDAAGWIKDQIVRQMHALVASPIALGSWFVGRFLDGIRAVADKIQGGAKWLVNKIVGAVKGFLGISSPSKVFEEIGGHMIEGLIKGMSSGDVMKFIGKHLGGAAKLAVKLAGNVVGSVGGKLSSGLGGLSGSKNKTIGHTLMRRLWGEDQWQYLEKLWNQESGWRTDATNSSSGAYGIPQALPASKMGSAGADWRTNPVTQIRWGLDYIKGRYGSPAGAWAHEVANNWYATGGKVGGSGSGDSVPAMLTPGEFVMRKSVVDKFGPTFFAAVNGMASGGLVYTGGWGAKPGYQYQFPQAAAAKPKAFPVDNTLQNPWLQALLTHQDYLAALGKITQAAADATKTAILKNAIKGGKLSEADVVQAAGMISSFAPQAADAGSFLTTVQTQLGRFDQMVRAGDLTSGDALGQKIATIRDNLGNPGLSPDDVLELRAELGDLIGAQQANSDATQAQTDALNALKDELKKNTDFAQSVTATQLGQTMRALADFFSGEIYGNYGQRSSTASAGSVVRY